MRPFDFHTSHPRGVRRRRAVARSASSRASSAFARTLVVSDRGIVADRATSIAPRALLRRAGIDAFRFHDFDVEPGQPRWSRPAARTPPRRGVDSIVALGGGSSLDCAKGINFVLTNGGTMRDYRGFGKASRPMLPMIGVPTTAGTGSDAQSYAIISDADTHAKMACGDPEGGVPRRDARSGADRLAAAQR